MEEAKAAKKDKWVKDHLGQLLITAGQINWASECEKALGDPVGARTALSSLRKRWDALLARLITLTRSSLSEVERKKVGAAGLPSSASYLYSWIYVANGPQNESFCGLAK